MAQKTPDATDEEFVYGHLAAYLDGELAGPEAKRVETVAASLGKPDLPRLFGAARGFLQVAMQGYSLGEREMLRLRQMLEGENERASQEARDMDAISRRETAGKFGRRILVVGAFLATVIGFVAWLTPQKKPEFKALDALIYEAVAMEEDGESRFDFPTDSISQVNDYLREYPEMGFESPALKEPPAGWVVEGATAIDYEVARIGAAQFGNARFGEKLFLFLYRGDISKLPKATPGNYKGLLYQAYENDKVNAIAWQIAPGVVALMVGHRSAPEIADVARAVSGL